jgi:hypothetical protein
MEELPHQVGDPPPFTAERTLAGMDPLRRLATATLPLVMLVATGCSDPAEPAQRETPGERPAAGPSSPGTGEPPRPTTTETLVPDGPRLAPALADAVRNGPRRARNPAEVVVQIVASEDAVADPRTGPEVLAAAGRLQQLAYRVLGTRPAWDDRVRAALPARLRRVVTDNVDVRREFRSMHRRLSDTLPAWRIVRPAPARALRSHYQEAERRFGVDWEYLAAINLVETGMGRIRGTSTAGAQGPMQFIPSTWDAYGEGDVNSPRDAILAAGRFLRAQGFTRTGGIPGALYRYNNSSAYVRGVTGLAEVMKRRPRAFLGYYHWEIFFLTTRGDVHLPVGYSEHEPVPAARWLATHPQR